MSILVLATVFGVIFAQETIISPLPSDFDSPKPQKTFAQITHTGVVLGAGLEDISTPALTAVSTQADIPQITAKVIDAPVLNATPTIIPQVIPTATPTPILPTPTPTPVPTSTPQPSLTAKRSSVTIAFLGDSMIDTLGPGFPAFKDLLTKTFPGMNATILNYGVGGTNIEYGIQRITNDYDYLGRHIPSLASQKPDIVVLESFGYNPFPVASKEDALNRHWLDMAKAVDTLRATIPGVKIVIAATIAPNAKVFGDGAAGLAFSPTDKWQHVDIIKSYLESATKFAKGEHLPLIDAYHATLQADGNGILSLINGGDHIHYSDTGRAFFAQKAIDALIATGWL